jgi:hypothetical protein
MTGDKEVCPRWVWLIVLYFAAAALMGVIIGLVAVGVARLLGSLELP